MEKPADHNVGNLYAFQSLLSWCHGLGSVPQSTCIYHDLDPTSTFRVFRESGPLKIPVGPFMLFIFVGFMKHETTSSHGATSSVWPPGLLQCWVHPAEPTVESPSKQWQGRAFLSKLCINLFLSWYLLSFAATSSNN